MKGPTQKTLHLLRENNYLVSIQEKWNHFAGIRQDLFGFIDIMGVKEGYGNIYIQATSWGNVGARVKKITADDSKKGVERARKAKVVIASRGARVEVWGWKPGNVRRDENDLKRVRITLDSETGNFILTETVQNGADLLPK